MEDINLSSENKEVKAISKSDVTENSSNKGKWKNVFIHGYKFRHQRQSNSKHYYVCTKNVELKCRCRLNRDEKGEYQLNGSHKHAPKPEQRESSEVMDTLKKKANSDKSRARVLISEACETITSQVAADLPSMSQMPRTINRVRNAGNISALVREPNKILLTPDIITTKKGDCMVLFDNENEEDRLIMFATKDNMRVLQNGDAIFCDGTFDVVPAGYKQLYTIHGEYFVAIFMKSIDKIITNISFFEKVNIINGLCL